MPPENLKFQEFNFPDKFLFQVSNQTLYSDIYFPELRVNESNLNSNSQVNNLSLKKLAKPLDNSLDFNIIQKKTSLDNSFFCNILENRFYYSFQFEKEFSFYISKNNPKECFYSTNSDSTDKLRHLYLDYVLPHILSLEYELVLHSSVLSLNNLGITIIGNSGTGKSTLVAALISKKWKLISDDFCLVCKNNLLTPSYPSIRLWPDSYKLFKKEELGVTEELQVTGDSPKLKLKIKDEKFNNNKVPIKSIFTLEPNLNLKSNYKLEKKEQKDTLVKLISSSYILDLNSSSKQFNKAGEIVKNIPVYSLAYKHKKVATDEVCLLINELVSQFI